RSYASTVVAKPFGTRTPRPARAAYISPSEAALPPTRATSSARRVSNHATRDEELGELREKSDAVGPGRARSSVEPAPDAAGAAGVAGVENLVQESIRVARCRSDTCCPKATSRVRRRPGPCAWAMVQLRQPPPASRVRPLRRPATAPWKRTIRAAGGGERTDPRAV